MSFKKNESQQMTFNDSLWGLTPREKKALEHSWAKPFAEEIFPAIDEERFSVLYSDKASRPNTPVNVIVGALIIKELFNLSDDEVVENLMLDPRYQYALHTTSFAEQPMSDKTLTRFRQRCYEYESITGIDLYRDCVRDLSGKIASLMNVSGQIRRMDSMMIEANIRKLSRIELIYRCIAKMVKYISADSPDALPEDMAHYLDSNDFNQVFYHRRLCDAETRTLDVLMADADRLFELCGSGYEGVTEYDLLVRCLSEQTVIEDGKRRLRTREDGGMRSDFMLSPADPDATFCRKIGKSHTGYALNFEESVGRDGSVVTDYQFEQNIYSDSHFLKDHISSMEKPDETVTLVTDGAYNGYENFRMAEEKNIKLVNTAMGGVENPDIIADFVLSEDEKTILECPMGHKPLTTAYSEKNDMCTASFDRNCCADCPHKGECRAKINKNTARVKFSRTAHYRSVTNRFIKSDEIGCYSRIRNGVETLPSIMRRVYDIDHLPRGFIRGKFFTGSKIMALNFRKLLAMLRGTGNYAQNPLIA